MKRFAIAALALLAISSVAVACPPVVGAAFVQQAVPVCSNFQTFSTFAVAPQVFLAQPAFGVNVINTRGGFFGRRTEVIQAGGGFGNVNVVNAGRRGGRRGTEVIQAGPNGANVVRTGRR